MDFALSQPSGLTLAPGVVRAAASGRKGVIGRGKGVNRRARGRVLGFVRGTPPHGDTAMKLISPALCALALGASAAAAQTPRLVDYAGNTWGYFYYERGGASEAVLTGQPGLLWGQPEGVITLVSRDGRALGAGDRAQGAQLARLLCEQQGRVFNTASQGAWLSNGRLSFDGDCSR